MKRVVPFLLMAACVGMFMSSCSNDSSVDSPNDTDTARVTVTGTDVSGCDGFAAVKHTDETRQESLIWSYDPVTRTLEITHAALILNCCGTRTVEASYANGAVTIYEEDQPESDNGRCRCNCPFDFRVTLEGVPEQVLAVHIELTVDDDTTEHWAGEIDLTEQQGSVIIGNQAPRIIATLASECDGFDMAKPAIDENAETLSWSYDAVTGLLDLHHIALILNCCGVHTVSTTYADGVVTIFENDQPDPEGGRCHCLCPFDFAVTFEGIPEQVLGVRIELTVDDDTTEHWAGAIDLTDQNGTISIGKPSP